MHKQLILLTGATGYIGGRLLKTLEKDPYVLRCIVREPHRLKGRADPRTQIMKGDILDKSSLITAMQGVDVAFYLIHSMGANEDFMEQDRIGACNFAEAASECKVKRIIYLGGLGENRDDLSTHLKSRHEVGDYLREKAKGVQVIEFRASIVIGSGSASFEMIRALCERLPIMIAPKWVWTLAQPISITDILAYLKKAIDFPLKDNPIFETGGKDQLSYGGIMLEYMRQRQLKRFIIPVPVLTPYLSSLWLRFITPLYAPVGKAIIESVRFPTVVQDHSAEKVFHIEPLGIKEAIEDALADEDRVLTHWSDSLSASGRQPDWTNTRFGNRIIDSRTIEVSVPPIDAFTPIRRLGGTTGWYYGNALWHMRGFIDLLVGGVGLRRGRRDPDALHVGDFLDFWRVEAIEPNHRLLLKAEMKLPGRAWLEFVVEPTSHGSTIKQTAIFDPVGLSGLLYWYVLYPIHRLIFAGMLRGIVRSAEKLKNQPHPKKLKG